MAEASKASENITNILGTILTTALLPDQSPRPQEEGREGLMSVHTMQSIEMTVQVGILPVLVLCGVVMNVLNMAVFLRQGLSDRINLYLLSLAVCDTGYIVFMGATRFFTVLSLLSSGLGEYWKVRGLVLIGVYASFFSSANCLTLLIAVERCVCVVWPLKAKTLLSLRGIKCLMAVTFIVCFLSNLLFCFKFDMLSYRDPTSNVTRYRPTVTQFYKQNSTLIDLLFETFNCIVPMISLAVVMVATIIIGVRLRSVLAWRQESANLATSTSHKERRESSVTQMLAVVCAIYTICTAPYVTYSCFHFFLAEFRPGGRYNNLAYATVALSHMFLCVNSSTNFVIYCAMSSRFRQTLLEMLRR